MRRLRPYFVFTFLVVLKGLARLFYRFETSWVGEEPPPSGDPWSSIRVAAVLHHTSLFDLLFIAALPARMLWQLARRAVAPGADITLERPILGRLTRLFVHRMIPISRKRDATWDKMLDAIGQDALVLLAPEGRMMRRGGLDKNGQPMTVRGGIADILEAVESLPEPNRLLLFYSQGVHHIQAPGERFPRLFKTFAANLDSVAIPGYLADRRRESEQDGISMRQSIIRDLEMRRDRHCPVPYRR